MATRTVQLAYKLPGLKAESLEVCGGEYVGAPYVSVVGRDAGNTYVKSHYLMFHADVLPDLIAAMRWVVAGPLEQQLIDKELER